MTQVARKALMEAIASELRPFVAALGIADEAGLRRVVARTRIKQADLDGDGKAEVLAHAAGIEAGCGATGNCPFWIFQLRSGRYVQLLEVDGETVAGFQTYSIRSTRSKGYFDVVLGSHSSASESVLVVFRFDGTRYRQSECYEAIYETTDGRLLKKPLLTACGSR